MITKSLSKPELFDITDENTKKTVHGCRQEWYATPWQRLSGCGPSVAANMIYYLDQTRGIFGLDQSFRSTESCLSLMEDVWKYVTPTLKGIPATKLFYEGVKAFADSRGSTDIRYEYLDVPRKKSLRPKLGEVLDFIGKALDQDAPVAFLNLCNGKEKSLDQWHWVTILSLRYSEDGGAVSIDILDDGTVKNINFSLWYDSTKRGGGFVYFTGMNKTKGE